jgi:hypothetical protein
VTLTVQECVATVRLLPQVVVRAKPAPLTAVVNPVSVVLWLLVMVITCAGLVVAVAWFPNASDVGETVTGATEVPESATLCAPAAVKAKVPVNEPATVGLNVTVYVQLAPAASEAPQVVVSAKFALIETPEIASEVV